jgi:steroid delta-isomerase-like uncharacterized protein
MTRKWTSRPDIVSNPPGRPREGMVGLRASPCFNVQMTGSDAIRTFMTNYAAAANAHRLDELSNYYASSLQFNDVQTGAADVVAGLTDLIGAFPDWQWETKHMVFEGDLAVAHMVVTGTHKGTFAGVAATGRTVRAAEFALYRVADGKIVEMWVTLDSASLMQQLS